MGFLTQEELHCILNYDRDTGLFTWKNPVLRSRFKSGDHAGSAHSDGLHYRIVVKGREYMAHQLAWLYVYGELVFGLDHIDRNGLNNKISNIRKATKADQSANQVHRGIRKQKNGRWEARIMRGGKRESLGSYQTQHDAEQSYRRRHAELNKDFSPYHGAHS